MTYPLTLAHLAAAGVSPGRAQLFLSPLNSAMLEYDITTGERPAMFLAQLCHESGCFRYMAEIWGPTPAQRRYEGRLDLGNTQPGDGKKFMGHGPIQITGRANHQWEADAFGMSIDEVIDWLQTPTGGCRSAARFWLKNGCNKFADNFDFVGLTKRINGGTNGLLERTELYERISASMD